MTKRVLITVAVGASIALIGVLIFLGTHELAIPRGPYDPSDVHLNELLWSAFGISLWLGGVVIASVGLSAWCREPEDW